MLRYRFLFEQMVRREFRQRYKGSVLGVLWYLVNPLVLMGVYALVFSVFLRAVDLPHYPLFLIIGLVVWVFFSQTLLAAAPSLVQQASLVRKVRFPREAIPGAVVAVQGFTFLVMLAVVVPVAVIVQGTLGVALLLLPLVVALFICLVLGISLLISVLHARFRDVEPVIAAALLPWFFLTPVLFRVQDLPGAVDRPFVRDLLQWGNPVAPFVQAMRDLLYDGHAPSATVLAYIALAGLLALAIGATVFRRMQRDLAVIV